MEVDAMDFSESPTQHLAEPEPLFGYASLNVKQNSQSNETTTQNEQHLPVFDAANLASLSGLVDVTTPTTERASMFKKAESPSEWTDTSAEDDENIVVKEEHSMSDTLASLNALLHQTSSRSELSLAMSAALTNASYAASSGSLALSSGMALDANNANACYPPFLGEFNLLNISPYPQAIPALARKCLTFTGYRNNKSESTDQTQQTNSVDSQSSPNSELATPSTPITTEALLEKGMQIRVLGIPQTGAKSRVETQVKLCLQLVTHEGDKVTRWTRLRLPEHMVARDCLKRRNSKPGSEGRDPTDSDVLNLEVAVVCSSDMTRRVITCVGCVHRERKRTLRKKENRHIREELERTGKTDFLNLKDEKVLERERSKIVLFNCNQELDFTSGGTILPTRITCYCRHHTEKKGFCILFTVRDDQGRPIAVGTSPPIMITDDHKASKKGGESKRRQSQSEYNIAKIERNAQRESTESTRRNKNDTNSNSNNENIDYISSLSTAQTSNTMSTVTSSGVPTTITLASHSPPVQTLSEMLTSPLTDITPASMTWPVSLYDTMDLTSPTASTFDTTTTTTASTANTPNVANVGINSFNANTNELLSNTWNSMAVTSESISTSNEQHNNNNNILNSAIYPSHGATALSTTPEMMQAQAILQLQLHEQSTPIYSPALPVHHPSDPSMMMASVASASSLACNLPANTAQSPVALSSIPVMPSTPSDHLPPRIDRVVPSEGPMHGGLEITVLGAHFYPGVTLMFGGVAALPTHFWSTSTLVCLLPPSPVPGPVTVTLKESLGMEGVALFTYTGGTDRALMELALQVVGLRMTGQLEEAHRIAMRIVGDNNSNNNNGGNSNSSNEQQQQQQHTINQSNVVLAADALALLSTTASTVRSPLDLEAMLLQSLHVLNIIEGDNAADISVPNNTQHTMLHLAVLLGLARLSEFLIEYGIALNAQDSYGFTALHFAAWTGQTTIVEQLLAAGASADLSNYMDQLPVDLARERVHTNVVDLLSSRSMHAIEEESEETDDATDTDSLSTFTIPENIAAPLQPDTTMKGHHSNESLSAPPPPYTNPLDIKLDVKESTSESDKSSSSSSILANNEWSHWITSWVWPFASLDNKKQTSVTNNKTHYMPDVKHSSTTTKSTITNMDHHHHHHSNETRYTSTVHVWRLLTNWRTQVDPTSPHPINKDMVKVMPSAGETTYESDELINHLQVLEEHGAPIMSTTTTTTNNNNESSSASKHMLLNSKITTGETMSRTITCEEQAVPIVVVTPRNATLERRRRRRRDRIIFLFWVPMMLAMIALALFRFIATDEVLQERVWHIVRQQVGA